MGHTGDGAAKCQIVKCQKIKYLDYGGGSQKKIEIMRFTHIDVNFDITYDGNQKAGKCA